jgi:hypothetical protein
LEVIIKQHIQKINLAYPNAIPVWHILTDIAAHDTHNGTKIETLHSFKTPFPFFSQSAVSPRSMWF